MLRRSWFKINRGLGYGVAAMRADRPINNMTLKDGDRMRKALLMALLALLASPAVAGEAKSERWKTLWDKQAVQTATWEGASYEQRLITTHNTFWSSVYAKCARTAKSAGIDDFSAVAVIDAEGKITEFVIFPDNPALRCFSEDMVGRRYPAPPVAPFHEGFSVTLGKR